MDLNEGYSKLYNELVRKAKINKIEDFADFNKLGNICFPLLMHPNHY